jgi:WhiB family redox-sensing transcriptional regulator
LTDQPRWPTPDPQHNAPNTPSEEGISVSTHASVADAHHRTAATGPLGLVHTGVRQLPCRDNPPDLWFAEKPEDVELAKALCDACPIRAACLAGALERSEPWGVWGGQLILQGTVVPRKRPRGRPRKNPVAA